MRELLEKNGNTANPRPEYPFVRLMNDGIWEVKATEEIAASHDYSPSALKKLKAKGRFTKEITIALKADSELPSAVMYLLRKKFQLL